MHILNAGIIRRINSYAQRNRLINPHSLFPEARKASCSTGMREPFTDVPTLFDDPFRDRQAVNGPKYSDGES